MTDDHEKTFLAAIAANINDADARAVYADWLEERGDPRGEYLRLEALLYAGPARILELTPHIDPTWLASVTRRCDVVLVETGSNKISVIKTVREVTGLGLKDSKDLVEAAMPRRVVLDLTFDEAHDIAAKFDATGARVVVMPHVGEVPGGYLKTPLRVALGYREQQLWITRVDTGRRIDAIKAVREVTGIALKQAKDLIDAVANGERRALFVQGPPEQIAAHVAVLRAACDVELV